MRADINGISMNDDYLFTIEEFENPESSTRLILSAFKELWPGKGRYIFSIVLLILAVVFTIIISISPETISLLAAISGTVLTIQLALFGCIFTVYSIFHAFLSDGFIKRISGVKHEDDRKQKSYLKNVTTYYESVLFLYFVCIGATGLVKLLTMSAPSFIFMFDKPIAVSIFAHVLLLFYLALTFRVFYEVKSVIYNAIIMFRASIAIRFLDFSEEDTLATDKKKGDVK